jgi:hypothetical protein
MEPQTESKKEKLEDLTDHLTDYADTLYKLAIVKLTQKVTQIASTMIAIIAICTIGVLVLLFGSIAAGWWLGTLLHSMTAGFLTVTGFYFLILVLLLLLRRKIIFSFIRDIIIRKFYD